VMKYIGNNISQYLKRNYNNIRLYNKLELLYYIARGLKDIHNKGFIHKDFHSGNILNYSSNTCYITDLGLCKPADNQDEKKIHGVLPYVAPEVLRGKIYTQSADIYSFGIIACEILSELPPYHNLPHNEFLTLKICQGLRPKFNHIKVPLLLENLIDQCLDADPLKRPTAEELFSIISGFYNDIFIEDTEFHKQYEEAKEFNRSLASKSNIVSSSYTTHPQAIYTSRLLDYKNLPKPQNSKEINVQFYNSLAISKYTGTFSLNYTYYSGLFILH
jgi:serine/threonine protein kinase